MCVCLTLSLKPGCSFYALDRSWFNPLLHTWKPSHKDPGPGSVDVTAKTLVQALWMWLPKPAGVTLSSVASSGKLEFGLRLLSFHVATEVSGEEPIPLSFYGTEGSRDCTPRCQSNTEQLRNRRGKEEPVLLWFFLIHHWTAVLWPHRG